MTPSSRTDPIHTLGAAILVLTMLLPTAAAAQSTRAASHVRSEDPLIAQLIADAPGLSVTFRDLVTAIDTTNGIVYVESGRCGRGARACLVLSVDVAGPNRILRVMVTTRRGREALIGSIGHELHHALEILRDPKITTSAAMFFHYFGKASLNPNRFETDGAIQAGHRIEDEVRDRRRVLRE